MRLSKSQDDSMTIFTLPSEDFGRSDERFRMIFRSTCQCVSSRFGLQIVVKCFYNPDVILLFILRSSFLNLCSPKEDLGRPKNISEHVFDALFRGVTPTREYSRFSLNSICNNYHTGIAVATSRWYDASYKYHLERTYCTRFGLHNVEKCFENALRNVCPTFPNLRLGRVKSSFGSIILSVKRRSLSHQSC